MGWEEGQLLILLIEGSIKLWDGKSYTDTADGGALCMIVSMHVCVVLDFYLPPNSVVSVENCLHCIFSHIHILRTLNCTPNLKEIAYSLFLCWV